MKTIAGGEMIGLESVRIEGDAAAGGGAADSPAGVRVLCDGQVRAHLCLVSRFPSDVRCRQLALSLRPLADAVAELRPKKTSTGGEMPPPAQVRFHKRSHIWFNTRSISRGICRFSCSSSNMDRFLKVFSIPLHYCVSRLPEKYT